MKLNQVIAILQGKKARATKTLAEAYRGWGVGGEALKGLTKTYQPLDEDGEKFPDEKKPVPLLTWEVIEKLKPVLSDFYDFVGTQENANQLAKADVVVNGTAILKDVPVTVLLFLEKQVTDLMTLLKSIPTLPSDKTWTFDQNKNCFVTEPETTTKTQKRPEVVVKYAATKEHPAQVEMFSVDKTVGHWKTIHLSGAMPVQEKTATMERLEQLQDAVKTAREAANSLNVADTVKYGEAVMDFVFPKK